MKMPAAVAALPKPARDALRAACAGDWSRVTVENGVATVHNAPQKSQAPRSAPKKKAPKVEVPKPRTEPPPPLTRTIAEAVEAPVPEPEPEPEFTREQAAEFREILRGEPDLPSVVGKRFKVHVIRAAAPDVDDRLFGPDEANIRTHKLVEFLQTHKSAMRGVDLTVFEEVVLSFGIDVDEAVSIIHNPSRIEARPESALKGYPVIRFTRGDVDVIVGFRNPRKPFIMRVDQNSLLVHDTHRVNRSGGGGSKRRNGVPYRPETIRSTLIQLGCEIPEFDLRTQAPVEVKYKDQSLGKLSPKDCTKSDGERMWQSFHRRWDAITRRS